MRAPTSQIDLRSSLHSISQGGLPTRAKERLADESTHKLFTSDLSVNEFLLTREIRAEVISQVMGSSIYHIGKIPDYKGKTGEIRQISEAHRDSRRRALSRLFQEAQIVRADAVIGVRLQERLITVGSHGKGGDDGDEVIEFTVVGTAIRAPWIVHADNTPVITDLNGQDFWALAREGFEPCGFPFDFCRYHVWHVMGNGLWTPGGEITSAHDAIEKARISVERSITAQAEKFGAEFVVGSDIKVTAKEVPCGFEKCELNDLDVDVSWFGTAVRRIPDFKPPHQANVPPLVLGMMKLGKKKRGDFIEGEEDESKKLEELAKKMEESAGEGE
ncbi:MAG: heavy metal-binding domain-containing protein [Polyangiaceae bacterium]